MEELAKRLEKKDVEAEARQQYNKFKKLLNEFAWDGNWFIRTTIPFHFASKYWLTENSSIRISYRNTGAPILVSYHLKSCIHAPRHKKGF